MSEQSSEPAVPTATPNTRITLQVDRDGRTGRLQLSINELDENNCGHGYRIAGPKFNGNGEGLLTATLDARDIAQIRSYLDRFEARS